MVYQLTDLKDARSVSSPRLDGHLIGVRPRDPQAGSESFSGQPMPDGHVRDSGNWPSGWWILPSVLGGLVVWIMIFRALFGWLF